LGLALEADALEAIFRALVRVDDFSGSRVARSCVRGVQPGVTVAEDIGTPVRGLHGTVLASARVLPCCVRQDNVGQGNVLRRPGVLRSRRIARDACVTVRTRDQVAAGRGSKEGRGCGLRRMSPTAHVNQVVVGEELRHAHASASTNLALMLEERKAA
jgi:hypothetical protein